MKKNSATFRKSSTRVTLERIGLGQVSGRAVSVSAGPVDGNPQEGRNPGKRQHEGVAQARELTGAEREREPLDGARRHVEGDVPADRPADGAEEEPLRPRVLDAGVGDHV